MNPRKRKSGVSLPELSDCIVIDVGSGQIKAGLASDTVPRLHVPTLVGRPVVRDHEKYSRHLMDDCMEENMLDEYMVLRRSERKDGSYASCSSLFGSSVVVGREARDKQALLELSRPVERGIVKNFNDMESIFESVFSKLRSTRSPILTPSNQQRSDSGSGGSVVLTETYSTSTDKQREKIFELMFETFQLNRVNVSASAALTLAARGATSGLVVDIGESKTEIVPIISGFVHKGAVKNSSVGGRTVTERLMDLLRRADGANYKLDKERDFFTIERIKENMCYIATDLMEERHIADTTNLLSAHLELPDKTLVMNGEKFLAPEVLFQPRYLGDPDKLGIADLIKESVNHSPIDNRTNLMRSIVLSGGSTLFPGFSERLHADLAKDVAGVYIDAGPGRDYSAFTGGCVMAETCQTEGWWIYKQDFMEKGCRSKRSAN
jgi:actin-related protein 2